MTRLAALTLTIAGAGGCGADDGATVTIIRGADGTAWLDLAITGAGLDLADGSAVIIQIGMPDRAPERLGLAEARVHGGGFTAAFPQVWENGLYKKKVIHVDADDDGACSGGELVLVDFSASVEDRDLTVTQPAEPAQPWGDFFESGCAEVVAEWPAE